MKKVILTIALASSLVFIASPLQRVHASGDEISTYEVGDDVVATSVYRVKSKKRVADTYGSWSTIVSNVTGASKDGEVMHGIINMGWSNSISGGISLSYKSKKGLTSTMGFDVTRSGSVSVGAGYDLPLNKGEKGYIKVRPSYYTYSCKLERKYSGTGVSYWSTVSGTYTSKKFKQPDYKTEIWR